MTTLDHDPLGFEAVAGAAWLGPVNVRGSHWSADGPHGFSYMLGEGHYFVRESDGKVWAEKDGEFYPASPAETAAVEALYQEDKVYLANRKRVAEEIAQGSAALCEALRMGMNYADGRPVVFEREFAPGVLFIAVGRNASHQFSAGVGAEGQRYYLAEAYEEEPFLKAVGSFSEVEYWGHY